MSARVSCENTADMTWPPEAGVALALDRRRPAAAEAGGGEVDRQRRGRLVDGDVEVGAGEAALLAVARRPRR